MSEMQSNCQIPLIHRTSFESYHDDIWNTRNISRSEKSSIEGKIQHNSVFYLSILVTEEDARFTQASQLHLRNSSTRHKPSTSSKPTESEQTLIPAIRNTDLTIELRNVTYRFDVRSKWYERFFELFSNSSSGKEGKISRSDSSPIDTTICSTAFGVTKLSVLVRKLTLDTCFPSIVPRNVVDESSNMNASSYSPHSGKSTSSRLLIGVGNLTLKSTLVSNSPRISIKVSCKDFTVRISNKLLQDATKEQSPLDVNGLYIEEYVDASVGGVNGKKEKSEAKAKVTILDADQYYDAHGLIVMGAIDSLDCKVDFNSKPVDAMESASQMHLNDPHANAAVSVSCDWGECCFFGCADSLRVLAVRHSVLISIIYFFSMYFCQ
jgi:hypothetical protein